MECSHLRSESSFPGGRLMSDTLSTEAGRTAVLVENANKERSMII
jgi:hypothetical protein